MPDSFTPLVVAKAGSRDAAFTPIQAKGPGVGAASSAAGASAAGGNGAGACSKPVVTLRRNGEVVSGIRIQCGCGQVIELSCVY
jgi:hypothetical protein